MKDSKTKKGDKAAMIISSGIIILGVISLFLSTKLGLITTGTGIIMFVMGLLSDSPDKKIQ